VKFKVVKKDKKTSARSGELRINKKKIKTPVLWFGDIVKRGGGSPKPWEYFKIDAIMMNACDILSNLGIHYRVTDDGIHGYLDHDGLAMLDSGGFLFQRKEVMDTNTTEILELYKKAKPDIGVVLDHPLNPFGNATENRKRWRKTLQNTELMCNNGSEVLVMPVVHGYSISELKKACREIREVAEPDVTVGIGSLVPLLRSVSIFNKFNNDSKLNYVVDSIKTVRQEFPKAFLHLFGVGGATTMHLMFSLGVDSMDSMGWRTKAAHGAIQLPGIGDRFIHPSVKRASLSKDEEKVLENCNCPICEGKKSYKIKSLLDNGRYNKTFKNRAIHNAWVFNSENILAKRMISRGDYYKFVSNRLSYSPLKRYFYHGMET